MKVLLSCTHVMDYEPAPSAGDIVLCWTCSAYREVVEQHWKVRCNDCRFARTFGVDKEGLYRAAGLHMIKRPGHRLDVLKDGELFQELSSMDDMGELPGVMTWVRDHQEHQTQLRELATRVASRRVSSLDSRGTASQGTS